MTDKSAASPSASDPATPPTDPKSVAAFKNKILSEQKAKDAQKWDVDPVTGLEFWKHTGLVPCLMKVTVETIGLAGEVVGRLPESAAIMAKRDIVEIVKISELPKA